LRIDVVRPHRDESMDHVSELNKRKVRLFVETVWNEGRLELVDELVADDYVGRVACAQSGVRGPLGVRELVSRGRGAHPGLHVKLEDQIADEDQVAVRWLATSTGPLGPVPCYAGLTIVRLLAGKQVDSHTELTDLLRRAG
jgi:predicted SnoaL-like aldol condensation-catalyzing enzyme